MLSAISRMGGSSLQQEIPVSNARPTAKNVLMLTPALNAMNQKICLPKLETVSLAMSLEENHGVLFTKSV